MATASKTRTSADDYLLELANVTGEEWFSILVDCVLAARACPKPLALDQIFECFLGKHGLRDTPAKLPTSTAAPRPAIAPFALKSITHGSGVNALMDGAELTIHPKLTVVYGHNGSGKSGFVRIIKRMAGSKTQEEIWQNVRKGARGRNACSASIAYESGGKLVTVQWAGESGVEPFRSMGIFDGKCVPAHLTKSLSFSYQPAGFELFQAVSDGLRGLQERLERRIREKQSDIPFLGFCDQRSEAGKFLSTVTAKTTVAEVDRATKWTSVEEERLKELKKVRSSLDNLDGQKEVLAGRSGKLESLAKSLNQAAADLSPRNLKLYEALASKLAGAKAAKKAKKGKTLEDYKLPEMDSEEWEQFIAAGEAYIDVSQHDEYPHDGDACIYCQQKVSGAARRLLGLYRDLFKTEDGPDVEQLEADLDEAIQGLEGSTFREDVPYDAEDFTKIFPRTHTDRLLAKLDGADALSKQCATILRGKSEGKLAPVSMDAELKIVAKAKEVVTTELRALAETQRTVLQRQRELDTEILNLQERQKLSKRRKDVERSIELQKWLGKARTLQGRLNTRSVTEVAKQAWNALVSDGFKSAFARETEALRAPTVALAFRGEYGSQIRDKSVGGLTAIDEVLSEGEQKAVALADFFAEQSMQSAKQPIVFDDPATSFDHERKRNIAERLVRESEARQVIVFTHDLVFASYLFELTLKDRDKLDASKAAFHDVRSEGDESGLVTLDYYQGALSFDAAVARVEELLPRLAKATGTERKDLFARCYSQLRSAVEKAVEERIFGKVVSRWNDQIQLLNAPRATLDSGKLERAKELHGKISRYIDAHNQSNQMIQHSPLTLEQLKADIAEVRAIAQRS